jgi:hypothetical protein
VAEQANFLPDRMTLIKFVVDRQAHKETYKHFLLSARRSTVTAYSTLSPTRQVATDNSGGASIAQAGAST